MTCGDRFECRFQVGEGLHAIDPGGFDQGCDAALCLATCVMAGEQRVLSIEGNWSDGIFDAVGVHLDATILQEGLQTVPVVVDIGEFLAEAGPGGDTATLSLEPFAKGFDQRRGSGLADGQMLAGGCPSDVFFGGADFGDLAQAFGGDL